MHNVVKNRPMDKALAFVLSLVLVWSSFPVQALAEIVGGDEDPALVAAESSDVPVDEVTDEGSDVETAPDQSGAEVLDVAAETEGDEQSPSAELNAEDESDATAKSPAGVADELAEEPVTSSEEPVLTAASDEELIDSGTWGACSWSLNTDGLLHIWPTDGESGQLAELGMFRRSPWHVYREQVVTVVMDSGVSLPENCYEMFYQCTSLSSLDASSWDTSHVTGMSGMFSQCTSLTSLDASGWDTSHVTDMSGMFTDCHSLETLNMDGWDTSQVTDTNFMFCNCYALVTLDLSGYETSSVEDMRAMFNECKSLVSLNLSGWDTSSVTENLNVFYGCSELASIDVSGWVLGSKAPSFAGLSKLTEIRGLSDWDTSRVTSMSGMFAGCTSLGSLDLSGWDTTSVTSMNSMFRNCSSLVPLGISGWNASNVTDMTYMFEGCTKLVDLDLSGWGAQSLTDIKGMFNGCSRLSTLDLSGWDTSGVTDMTEVFRDCTRLASLDLSGWSAPSATSMNSMFLGCSSLTSLDLSGWDVSAVTDMTEMFRDCTKLASLNLSGWKTSSVTLMQSMFYNCSSLSVLDVSNWDVSQVENMGSMFSGCGVESLDFSHWNTEWIIHAEGMITGCGSLKSISVGTEFTLFEIFSDAYPQRSLWSTKDEKAYTAAEIQASRVGIADTYLTNLPKQITVKVSDATKAFGESDPEFNVELIGAEETDNITYELSREPGEQVGTYEIVATGSPKQGDCFVAYESGTLTIEPRQVTVRAKDASKVFGDNDPTLAAEVEGTVGEDVVEYALARNPGEDVGTYAITVEGEAQQGNYVVSYESGTLTVNPKTVTVRAKDAEKTFGYPDPSFDAVVEGTIGDDFISYAFSRAAGENVGTYTIQVTGRERQGNYSVTYIPGTLSVLARKVTVTAKDAEKVYGEDDPELEANITGIIDDYSLDYALAREAGESAGTYAITPTGGELQGNYRVEYVPGEFVVRRRSATVTADSLSKHVGETDPQLTATVTGLVDGDTLVYSLTREAGEAAGVYEIAVSGDSTQGNYEVTYANGKLTIAQFSIADAYVSSIPAATYNGQIHQPIPQVLVGDVQLTRGTDYTLAYRDNVNAGTATLMIIGIGKYTGYLERTFVIEPRPVTVTALDAEKAAGEDDPPLLASVAGLVGDDTVEYALARADGEAVGSYVISATGSQEQGNYLVTFVNGTFVINASSSEVVVGPVEDQVYTGAAIEPKPEVTLAGQALELGTDYRLDYEDNINVGEATILITFDGIDGRVERKAFGILPKPVTVSAKAASKTFGESDPDLTATVEGLIGSDEVAYTVSRQQGERAGSYLITPTGDKLQGNYQISYESAAFTINPRSIEDAQASAIEQCVYNGEEFKPAPEVSLSGTSLVRDTDYTLEWRDNVNAGTAHVIIAGQGNYSGEIDRTFVIGRRPVTVTARDLSKAYGEDDPELTATVEGLVGGDAVAYELSREPGEEPGTYAIVPSGDAEQGNYQVSFVEGTLTIVRSAIDAEVMAPDDQVYDGTAQQPKPSVTARGSALEEGTDYELSYENNTNVGQASVTVTFKGTYEDADPVIRSFAILPREVTVTAADASKAYGEGDPELEATVEGTVGDDAVAYELTREPGEDAGTYEISASGDELQGNYRVAYAPGTLTIERRPVTVTAADASKAYGEGDPELTATVEGLVGDDTVDYELSREPGEAPGAYKISVAGDAEQGNYQVSFVEGTLTIEGRPVTVTARNLSKAYGEDDPELTAAVEGTVGDDTVTYTLTREPGEEAGTYAIVPSGDAEQGNYQVSFVEGTLTIQKRSIADAEIGHVPDQLYKGKAIEPKPDVTMDGKKLVLGTDYTLSYRNNAAPGTATIIVRGVGNYTSEATTTFRIGTKSLEDDGVVFSVLRGAFGIEESDRTPDVDIFVNYKEYYGDGEHDWYWEQEWLEEDKDFSVEYFDYDRIGKARVVVTGIGDYVGTLEEEYEIVDCLDVDEHLTVRIIGDDTFLYHGEPITPKVDLYLGYGTDGMFKEGVDYTVSYLSNNKPGTGYVVIKGEGSGRLKGTTRKSFTILNPPVVTLNDDDTRVDLLDPLMTHYTTSGDGIPRPSYLMRNGVLPQPKVAVSQYVPLSASGDSYTWVNLKEGVDYKLTYTYPKDLDYAAYVTITGINGAKGSLTEPFFIEESMINVEWLALDKYSLADRECLYTGEPVEPKLAWRPDFIEDVDYLLLYDDNDSPGTCTITVIGIGSFYGVTTLTVPIVEEYTSRRLEDCVVDVGPVFYKGNPVKPEITITDPATGKVLDPDYDETKYSVTFENNDKPGTGIAHIVASHPYESWNADDYLGSIDVPFAIEVGQIKDTNCAIVGASTYVYNGKPFAPKVKVTIPKGVPSAGKVLKEGTDYTLSYRNNVNGGTASIVVTGKGDYVGTKEVKFTISKIANPLAAAKKKAKVAVKLSKVQKKKQVTKSNIKLKNAGVGTITYSNASTSAKAKKFKVNAKNGKVTVPKGTKKGTYRVKIGVTAAGNAGYLSATKVVSYKIVVK